MAQLVNRKTGNSVHFPDTKHFAAMPADWSQTGSPLNNTGVKTSTNDAPRCIMRKKKKIRII